MLENGKHDAFKAQPAPRDDSRSVPRPGGLAAIEEHVTKVDGGMTRNLDDDINTLLVFAGLFSAVVTAFVIEFYSLLQVDTTDVTNQLLAAILSKLYESTNSTSDSLFSVSSSPFHPSVTSRAINVMWILSLVFSLAAALLGMLAKQWMREYMQWTTLSSPPRDVVWLRQIRYQAWEDWNVVGIIGTIPGLLEIALLLFLAGLVILLWTLDVVVFAVVTVFVAILFTLAFTTVILPIFSRRCPYKSPIGWGLLLLHEWTQRLLRTQGSDTSIPRSWRQRDADIKYIESAPGAEDIVEQCEQLGIGFKSRIDSRRLARDIHRQVALANTLAWVRCDSQDPHLHQAVRTAIKDLSQVADEKGFYYLLICNAYLLRKHPSISRLYTPFHNLCKLDSGVYGLSHAAQDVLRRTSGRIALLDSRTEGDISREEVWIQVGLLAASIEERVSRLTPSDDPLDELNILNCLYLLRLADSGTYRPTLANVFKSVSAIRRSTSIAVGVGFRELIFQMLCVEADRIGDRVTLVCEKGHPKQIVSVSVRGPGLFMSPQRPTRSDMDVPSFPSVDIYFACEGWKELDREDLHLFMCSAGYDLRVREPFSDQLLHSDTVYAPILEAGLLRLFLAMTEAVLTSIEHKLPKFGAWVHILWIPPLHDLTTHQYFPSHIVPPAVLVSMLGHYVTEGPMVNTLEQVSEHYKEMWVRERSTFIDCITRATSRNIRAISSRHDFDDFFDCLHEAFRHLPLCEFGFEGEEDRSTLSNCLNNLVCAVDISIKRRMSFGWMDPSLVPLLHPGSNVMWYQSKSNWVNQLLFLAEFPRTFAGFFRLVPSGLIELLRRGLEEGLIEVRSGNKEEGIECLNMLQDAWSRAQEGQDRLDVSQLGPLGIRSIDGFTGADSIGDAKYQLDQQIGQSHSSTVNRENAVSDPEPVVDLDGAASQQSMQISGPGSVSLHIPHKNSTSRVIDLEHEDLAVTASRDSPRSSSKIPNTDETLPSPLPLQIYPMNSHLADGAFLHNVTDAVQTQAIGPGDQTNEPILPQKTSVTPEEDEDGVIGLTLVIPGEDAANREYVFSDTRAHTGDIEKSRDDVEQMV